MIRAVLYIFVKAATTLLRNIIRDPSNPMALSDLKLIEPLLTLLGVLAKSSKGRKSGRLNEMRRSCVELFQRANMAVESINLANMDWMDWDQHIMSEQPQKQESLEDFFRSMDSINSGYDVELDTISPGISRDFAFAVEQQFQASTRV